MSYLYSVHGAVGFLPPREKIKRMWQIAGSPNISTLRDQPHPSNYVLFPLILVPHSHFAPFYATPIAQVSFLSWSLADRRRERNQRGGLLVSFGLYFLIWQYLSPITCFTDHLSSNLFLLYIFGKLVEEEEGNFALWLSYISTGVGANVVSWLILPRNAVSMGASGAVFGLFAISVLVKMSWDWRKILEVLILGQLVIDKVMEAAQASTGLSGTSYALQGVNHIAHLSGALVGVLLVWLVSKIPRPPEQESLHGKRKKGSES